MNAPHTLGDGLIVMAIAAAVVAWLYMKHRERQRRLEIVHEERMAAMQKDIPLPELRFDEPQVPKPDGPHAMLLHGVVWLAFGVGGVVTLAIVGMRNDMPSAWSLPLPLVFLGAGLVLYYALTRDRER